MSHSAPIERINLANMPIAHHLPARAAGAHKGDFGHVLVVGGNQGMGGAAMLATHAALRTGAGKVSCALFDAAAHIALLTRCPEAMVRLVESGLALQPQLAQASVLAVGPGLGQDAWAELMLQQCLQSTLPWVLDADGLNLLATPSWQQSFAGRPTVLTPHAGEAAKLLQVSAEAIQQNRSESALALAKRYEAVVVLKGQGSLIADPQGRLVQCTAGNPGMSSGGMGDVLTGMVAGLLAQGLDAWQAACLGVCLHAEAADQCVQQTKSQRSLLASDLFEPLSRLVE